MTVQEFRKASYGELERRTGIRPTHWSLYFTGKRQPGLDQMQRVAEAFQASTGSIVEAFLERRQKNIEKAIDVSGNSSHNECNTENGNDNNEDRT